MKKETFINPKIIPFKMNKKAAVSLPINLMVVIIISLVILGLGVTLLYQFMGEAVRIKADLDDKTAEELERLLVDQGQKVALPLHTAYLNPGENHVFGIGILNIKSADDFTIEVSLSAAADLQDNPILEEQAKTSDWLLFPIHLLTIKENEHIKEGIMVSVPKTAVKGQYIFNVIIRDSSGKQYGNTQKFYVNVK